MSILNKKNAVSEIVGTILLLGLAISVFSVLYLSVLGYTFHTDSPNPNILAYVEGNCIIVEHQGGEDVSPDTAVRLDLGDGPISFTVGNLLIDSNGDGKWNLGERLVYEFHYSIDKYTASIDSVDIKQNELLIVVTLNKMS